MQLKVRGEFEAAPGEGDASSKLHFLRPIRLTTLGEPKLDVQLQAKIGQELRSYYAELMNEAVPKRLIYLVNRLDRKH
jgi:hypothetical protein